MDRLRRIKRNSNESNRNSNESNRTRSVVINVPQEEDEAQSSLKRNRNYSLPEVIGSFLKRNSQEADWQQQPRKASSAGTVTFFSALQPTFGEVRQSMKAGRSVPFIPCGKFVEASEQFLRIFDRLDNMTLMTLKEKMRDCVDHMKKVMRSTKVKGDSLLAITEFELKDEKAGKHGTKTPTFFKLLRNLATINLFVGNLIDPNSANHRNVRNSFLAAYAVYMERRHKWITQRAVHAASRLMCSYEQAVDRLVEMEHSKIEFFRKEAFIAREGLAYNRDLDEVLKVIVEYLEKKGCPL